MIDWRLYRLMNWSVLITGFCYWAMILDRRPWNPPMRTDTWTGFFVSKVMRGSPAVMSPLERIISPIITMVPQIIAGALIVFATEDLYPIFNMCGRALDITAVEDQVYGGIIIWLSSAVVESIGIVYALWIAMRLRARQGARR